MRSLATQAREPIPLSGSDNHLPMRLILASPTEASALYNTVTFSGYAAFDELGGKDRYLTFAVSLSRPSSRGLTDITSPSASSPGLQIDPKYLAHPLDVEVLARHLQAVERVKKRWNRWRHSLSWVGSVRRQDTTCPISSRRGTRYRHRASIAACHFIGTCSQMPPGDGWRGRGK